MLRSILVLPDGRELTSGADAELPLMSVTLTESVNDHEELTMGAVFANILEARVNTYQKTLELTAGDEVVLYKEDDRGQRHRAGVFVLEKPTRPSPETMELRGFDRVIRLNRDLSAWLKGLDGWPYRLTDFAGMVCDACGLAFAAENVPNGDFLVQSFTAEVTGYQLMRWIGEVCCRFCRANPEGKIELGWYTPAGVSITPSGDSYYLQNSLSYEEYEVAPVDAVQLRLANDQSGVLWPEAHADSNSYIIEWNPILLAGVTEGLLPVLDTIKAQMPATGYRSCKVSIPATLDIHAGNTVQITDKNGVTFSTYVMTKVQKGQKDTLECTGSLRRDSSTAQNNKTEQEKTAALKSYADRVAQEKADAAKKAAQADLVNFSQAVAGSINSLQSQIDGNITTWFDNYVPTTENEPASSWTTDALKNRHLGDLFYIVDNDRVGGQVYRWALTNGSYGWQLVEDTEVAKALADAAKAQDTADGKRRVFVTQPVPPYDIGDLWAQGDSGDLMVCKTAKATGSFEASDWKLATDYINSEAAGSIAQGKVDAQTQLDIFNKLTDNGKMEGLFMQDGQLYINASYMKSGIIDAELVQVINLVAEHVSSQSGDSALNISGAVLKMLSGNNQVVKLDNEYADESNAYPIMYMSDYRDGVNTDNAEFSPHHIKIGGTSMLPTFAVYAGGNSTGKIGEVMSEMYVDSINPGKKVLYSGSVSAGSTFTVPKTSYYDLFAIKLQDSNGGNSPVVLAYKYANTIYGVGGWCGTETLYKELYFVSATFSGNTWTLVDAGLHDVYEAGGISASTRLQIKEIIGVI